jgi:S-formylglutathione hydrolase FrmB
MPVMRAALVLGAAISLAGCAELQPTVRPLVQVLDPAPCAAASGLPRPLVVVMPGRAMALDELVSHGFVAALRRRGFDVDVALVDAHLGYFQERVVFEALREDVLVPAHQGGRREVWLTGISLGGYGALLYDARHPGDIAGVVALAPYLGLEEVVAEVRRAGGLDRWQPPPLAPFDPSSTPGETDMHLWRWLQRQAAAGPAAPAPPHRLPIFLGFGDRDRFVAAQRLLAAALPAERVVVTAGGHDWPAWQPAWDALLDRVPWPRRAECVRTVAEPATG